MTKNNTTTNTTTTTNTADIIATAQKAVYICLRARHEKSGLHFITELQNAQSNDRRAENAPSIAEELATLEKVLTAQRAELADLADLRTMSLRQSERVTLPQSIRAQWATTAEQITEHIKNKKHEIKRTQAAIVTLEEELARNYSDRADLVQSACVAVLETMQNPAPITAHIIASYGATTAEELTETERADAQERANFRYICSAVGRAIGELATPDALNAHTTKATKATAEDAQKWLDIFGGIGSEYKHYLPMKRARNSDCWETMEYRDTKTQKGYYLVKHYATTAQYQYIEDISGTDENGENDINYVKTYNPFVSTSADLDRIEELTERAKLTDRQKLWIEYFCRACRHSSDFRKCKQYAFRKIGITTRGNQDVFFGRLKKALKTATAK